VAWGAGALLATNAVALAVPWLLGLAIEALRGPDPVAKVPTLCAWMIGAAVVQAGFRIASRIYLFNAARMAEYDLRSDLLASLLAQAPSYYRTHTTGDLMSRLTNDVQTVRAMWGPGVLNVVNTAFVFSTALALMLAIDWQLALLALLPYPIMIVFGKLFAGRLYRSSRAVQDKLGEVSASIQEDLSGMAVIKNYTLEDMRRGRFAGMADELLVRNMELVHVRGQLLPVLAALGSVSTIIVVWLGGQAVIDGRINLGQLVQLNAYLALLIWPTLALGWMMSLFQRGYAAWARLCPILEAEPSIRDGAGPALAEEVRGTLEVRGLTVEIDGRKVLRDVSLTVPAGTMTAIVGKTGAGKSLLCETLPRLLEIPAGTVFLDGRDVTELPLASLRRAIGYAPQEAFLFSTTIADNIRYGREHTIGREREREHGGGSGESGADAAHQAKVAAAATAAGLDRDLAALPEGMATMVGERGITLSGGQRQRVALARAIAAAPRVLILDDSLSSVDTHTEREILEHLAQVMQGRTAILISHRVAAIRRADRIVVLDEGRVVELGDHESLLRRGGVYAELYRTDLAAAGLADDDAGARRAAPGGEP
jgi:ATP-binding cassette subfamily B protein